MISCVSTNIANSQGEYAECAWGQRCQQSSKQNCSVCCRCHACRSQLGVKISFSVMSLGSPCTEGTAFVDVPASCCCTSWSACCPTPYSDCEMLSSKPGREAQGAGCRPTLKILVVRRAFTPVSVLNGLHQLVVSIHCWCTQPKTLAASHLTRLMCLVQKFAKLYKAHDLTANVCMHTRFPIAYG